MAKKHHLVIRDFYKRLFAQGNPKQVMLMACLRKLLVMINAMTRDNKPGREPA